MSVEICLDIQNESIDMIKPLLQSSQHERDLSGISYFAGYDLVVSLRWGQYL